NPKFNASSLDDLWFTKKSIKIRSGFYVQSYEVDGSEFILVNGFHPAQIQHFTGNEQKTLVMVVNSDADWDYLRNEMIGDTFPEKATSNSIRGKLYSEPNLYGFDEVTIANNGVHLSAGPFEALFEIQNFFTNLLGVNLDDNEPLVIKKLKAKGISYETAIQTVQNPSLPSHGSDLFSETEHMNTEEALTLWLDE
ncbi:MAG: hypothetical protein AAFY41_19610, partial [Bacteroidota bacterium]